MLRELAPQVLAALVRRHGQFDACEDAVQEALLAATLQWPTAGVPGRPRSWLLPVAGRSLVDQWQADSARRRREQTVACSAPSAAGWHRPTASKPSARTCSNAPAPPPRPARPTCARPR